MENSAVVAANKARELAEAQVNELKEELSKREKLLKSIAGQLTQQTAQLNVILDNTLAGIVLLDDTHYVLRANKCAESIFGYDEGNLFGMHISDMIDGPLDEVYMRAIVENDRYFETRCEDYCGTKENGDKFPLEISISKILIKERDHTVWFLRDITQRKQREKERQELEQELRQAHKLESLGTLASGIAHEINTPIQFVGDNLEFLQEAFAGLLQAQDQSDKSSVGEELLLEADLEDLDEESTDLEFYSEEIPTAIAQSLEGIARVNEIVRSVRDFSHPGSQDPFPTDINEAVKSTATISRNQWKYIADLELELFDGLPMITCVPGEINQVLLNLIVNAAQAIEQKSGEELGSIKITTRCDSENIEIRISDTGCGIPDDVGHRIFDPFFTTKDVGKGTGQGLALAHAIIVSKHGGKLSFNGNACGGTDFLIHLPTDTELQQESAA